MRDKELKSELQFWTIQIVASWLALLCVYLSPNLVVFILNTAWLTIASLFSFKHLWNVILILSEKPKRSKDEL